MSNLNQGPPSVGNVWQPWVLRPWVVHSAPEQTAWPTRSISQVFGHPRSRAER